MPVYNTGRYLDAALASIGGQRFKDFELIAINDGSTDNSSNILRSFADRESRCRVIERPNKGLIATRNELLDEAKGEFVAWMDSDDLSHPDRLAQQVATFDADSELVCVGTCVKLVDDIGRPLGVEDYPVDDEGIRSQQMLGGGFRFSSTMQRRAVATAVGGFRAPFRMGEDFDFLLRIAERGRLTNLDAAFYVYRQHLLNTCSTLGKHWPEYRAVILQLAEERRREEPDKLQRGGTVSLPPISLAESRSFRPIVLIDWAQRAAIEGDRSRALGYTLRAFKMSPLNRAVWRQLAKLLLLKT